MFERAVDEGVVEVVGGVAGHAEALHDGDGLEVAGRGHGDDLGEVEGGEAEVERGSRALGGVALAPVIGSETPPDLDAGREVRFEAGDLHADHADDGAGVARLGGPHAETAALEVGSHAPEGGIGGCAVVGLRVVAHDDGVGVERSEGIAIGLGCGAEDEAFGGESDGRGDLGIEIGGHGDCEKYREIAGVLRVSRGERRIWGISDRPGGLLGVDGRPALTKRIAMLVGVVVVLAIISVSKHRATLFGSARASTPSGDPTCPHEPAFPRVQRSGAVDLHAEYDLTGLTIPEGEIHTLLPRDAIPSLTDPKREAAAGADWIPPDGRVIVVRIGKETVGVPIAVVNWHEIVNMEVGGVPVAVTYCPLCDSAAVFSRRAGDDGPVLEFGVSGALYNSNVLMYDRAEKGLWSQLGMHAVSGPRAGAALEVLPVEVVGFTAFKLRFPGAQIVSKETGHDREYSASPYEAYFQGAELMVPVAAIGDALPPKTLGIGISLGEGESARAWFVPVSAIGDAGTRVETPAGEVVVIRTDGGVAVASAPEGVRSAQTFYYSWSAFYPDTQIVQVIE